MAVSRDGAARRTESADFIDLTVSLDTAGQSGSSDPLLVGFRFRVDQLLPIPEPVSSTAATDTRVLQWVQ